jgi:hypothetical protein
MRLPPPGAVCTRRAADPLKGSVLFLNATRTKTKTRRAAEARWAFLLWKAQPGLRSLIELHDESGSA